MVVVPKTDESIRLCINYRKVNEIVAFNAFPMPEVFYMRSDLLDLWYLQTFNNYLLIYLLGNWKISRDFDPSCLPACLPSTVTPTT
ncbi:hypothetical protein Y1Q_0002360 [Alligator mississippiensis]|uniref:Uncharacterized protein n=1 Tax=Alligator mississippiensis TaxID=8496 RepID=A0A151MGU3_ALLMI|nr:hypothetical protein Y1Q_0002360 [Alligator mississippiensis]